jgi:hypothetical protein
MQLVGGVLIVAVVFGAWLVVPATFAENPQNVKSDAATLALVASLWGSVLVILGVAALAVSAIVRGLWAAKTVFGDTAWARLAGLGVIALFFPMAVYRVIAVPFWFVAEILSDIPGKVNAQLYLPILPQGQTTYRLETVFESIAMVLQSLTTQVGQLLGRYIEWLPITEAILALALWAIIGRALSAATEQPDPSGESRPGQLRISAFVQKLSPYQRHQLLLGGVLALSAYLSITAIVAIPWLQDTGATDSHSKERLIKSLQAHTVDQVDFDKRYPVLQLDDQSANPFSGIQAELEKAEQRLKQIKDLPTHQDGARNLSARVAILKGQLLRVQNKRKDLVVNWDAHKRSVKQWVERLSNSTVNSFESETSSPMAGPQRRAYFRELEQWYGRATDLAYQDLDACLESIMRWNSVYLPELSERVAQRLAQDFSNIDQAGDLGLSTLDRGYGRSLDWGAELTALPMPMESSTCKDPRSGLGRPEPPEPGFGWGPFGSVSHWLLVTQSVELALITGMLGFGLFGAAISSFVAKGSELAVEVTPTGGFVSLIVRGLSAAIIVFLAAKGGLAAVATGETSPNAYVLFFVCLVGAVFSERVWTWARKYLEVKFAEPTATPQAKPDAVKNPPQP